MRLAPCPRRDPHDRTAAPRPPGLAGVFLISDRVGSCLLAGKPSWSNLSELDLVFKRSSRRAFARRREPRKPNLLGRRSVRASLLALFLLAVVAESIGLESSNAKPPAAHKANASVGAACPVPARFRNAFAQASAKTGVPASLLVATAYVESRMDPAARS